METPSVPEKTNVRTAMSLWNCVLKVTEDKDDGAHCPVSVKIIEEEDGASCPISMKITEEEDGAS